MKHMRKPTMPVAPWDIPEADGKDWDFTPDEINIEQARQIKLAEKKALTQAKEPVEKPVMHSFPPAQSTPVRDLVGRTFMGALNVSDLHYIAMALLQTHDELCELRERIRILEAGKE